MPPKTYPLFKGEVNNKIILFNCEPFCLGPQSVREHFRVVFCSTCIKLFNRGNSLWYFKLKTLSQRVVVFYWLRTLARTSVTRDLTVSDHAPRTCSYGTQRAPNPLRPSPLLRWCFDKLVGGGSPVQMGLYSPFNLHVSQFTVTHF